MKETKKKKKPLKPYLRNPKSNANKNPLGVANKTKTKTNKEKKKQSSEAKAETPIEEQRDNNGGSCVDQDQPASASQKLSFFLDSYQSFNKIKLSPLEIESIPDTSILELSECSDQDAETLGKDLKASFGTSWKKALCGKKLSERKVEAGNPAILTISTSALRAIELLRGVRSLTKDCHAVKLFSKHMKVEEQVTLLENRVNIASGTPNRIKKLIDMEALGMSRLTIIVLDIRPDVKGFSLLTLPQVSNEFWDLYKSYFHQRVVEGTLRLGLYGPLPKKTDSKKKKGKSQ